MLLSLVIAYQYLLAQVGVYGSPMVPVGNMADNLEEEIMVTGIYGFENGVILLIVLLVLAMVIGLPH